MEVLNMLNTKYFIMQDPASRQAVARINPGAYGPAWIVKGIKYVQNSDQEMHALDSTSLRDTAVVQEKYKGSIKFPPQFDSSATIRVTLTPRGKLPGCWCEKAAALFLAVAGSD